MERERFGQSDIAPSPIVRVEMNQGTGRKFWLKCRLTIFPCAIIMWAWKNRRKGQVLGQAELSINQNLKGHLFRAKLWLVTADQFYPLLAYILLMSNVYLPFPICCDTAETSFTVMSNPSVYGWISSSLKANKKILNRMKWSLQKWRLFLLSFCL